MMSKQKANKNNFEVVSSGLSKSLILDSGIKFNFFPNNKDSRVEGVHFVNMVRRSIDKYIEENGIVDKVDENPQVQTFNSDGISLAGDNDVCCLDLNSCYWRTANILGYIDDKLYKKGVESGLKKGLLISIGALNKLKHIDKYENGKKVSTRIDEDYKIRYSPFYWNIIKRVRDLMMTVYEQLGDDFYMWLTDCAFIKPDSYDKVEKIFNDAGYPFKIYKARFTLFDGINVFWYDYKAEQSKTMPLSNRDIKDSYLTWKTIRDYNAKINNNEI